MYGWSSVLAVTDHINKGRDEDEDDGKYSNQGAVGARLDNLLRDSLHRTWKELHEGKKRKEIRFTPSTDGESILPKYQFCLFS